MREKSSELAEYGVEVDVHMINTRNPVVDLSSLDTDGIAMLPAPWLGPVQKLADEKGIPLVYYNLPCEGGLATERRPQGSERRYCDTLII